MVVQDIIQNIFATRQITASDRDSLRKAMLADESLAWEEYDRIRQIYELVSKGVVQVIG